MSLDSPYSDVLLTNYVPSAEEVPGIKAVIQREETRARTFDRELLEIDQAIAELQARRMEVAVRRALSQHVAECHASLLTPVRALPLDILSRIFQTMAPTATTTTSKLALAKVWRQHPIVTMSHVCRQWRELAISMRTLWTTISLCDMWDASPFLIRQRSANGRNPTFKGGVDRFTDMVTAFVSRADGCPTTLFVAASDPEYDDIANFAEVVQPLVDALRLGRWENIEFTLQIHNPSSPLLRLLNVPLHSKDTLQCARLQLCSTRQSLPLSDAISGSIDIEHAIHLTSLDIDISGNNLGKLRVKWESLTTLGLGPFERRQTSSDLYSFTVSHAFEVLRRCPNLIHCRLRIYPVNRTILPQTDWPSPTPVTLPHLRTLNIIGRPPPRSFASSVTLPALRVLSVINDVALQTGPDGQRHPYDEANSIVCELFRIYGGQLTDVSFDYGSLTQSALISCLESLQSVTSMTTTIAYGSAEASVQWGRSAVLDGGTLDRLTPRFDDSGLSLLRPCLCPSLTRIACAMGPLEDNYQDWVDFVAARRMKPPIPGVAWLERARVAFAHDGDANPVKEMRQELLRRGCDLIGVNFSNLLDGVHAANNSGSR